MLAVFEANGNAFRSRVPPPSVVSFTRNRDRSLDILLLIGDIPVNSTAFPCGRWDLFIRLEGSMMVRKTMAKAASGHDGIEHTVRWFVRLPSLVGRNARY